MITDKNTEKRNFGIHFGALCPSINEQLIDQGISKIPANINSLQRYSDCITELYLEDLLTATATRGARKKLLKMITKSIERNGNK
jgi:hypothetical protein